MSIASLHAKFLKSSGVNTDTRTIQIGEIFFALKGENFDGNLYAAAALEKGASHAVIDAPEFAIDERYILVEDVLSTLQGLAHYHRSTFSIPVIGLTGSNGKTTTKELMAAALSTKHKVLYTQGNLNNHIGVPLTLLALRREHEIAIIEMGANHLGEIAELCNIAAPNFGLITNCGTAHIEGFGSEENIKKGKGELYDYLRNNKGLVFLNTDYDYLVSMAADQETLNYSSSGITLLPSPFLQFEMENQAIKTQLIGSYNLPNVLAAFTVGRHFGVEEELLKTAITSYVPANNRSEYLQARNGEFILDAYNANPSSMKLAIENLANTISGKKVLILGDMLELGSTSQMHHNAVVELSLSKNFDAIVLVGKEFYRSAAQQHPSIFRFTSTTEARNWFENFDFSGAWILIKGSRGIGLEQLLTGFR